jgi:hypothetical protein
MNSDSDKERSKSLCSELLKTVVESDLSFAGKIFAIHTLIITFSKMNNLSKIDFKMNSDFFWEIYKKLKINENSNE